MPCSDGGYGRDDYGDGKERGYREGKQDAYQVMDPLLCSACRALEGFGYDFDLNPALAVWWDNHKKDDAERTRKEHAARLEQEAVDAALVKQFKDLTDEDKKLLKKHKLL